MMAVAAILTPSAFADSFAAEDLAAPLVSAAMVEFDGAMATLDDDQDGKVKVRRLMAALRSVGYGSARSQQGGRGRGGGQDPTERFHSLDANGDGLLSGDEPGPYMRGTAYFDDGKVTLEEYLKAWDELAARRGGRGGRGGRGRSGGSGGGGRFSAVRSSDVEFVAGFDPNHDGVVTVDEIREVVSADAIESIRAKTSLDVNRDGTVSAREYALSQPSRGDQVDADGLDGHSRGHFGREDLDRDGVISAADVAARVRDGLLRRARAIRLSLELLPADRNQSGSLEYSELPGEDVAKALGVTASASIEVQQLYPKLYGASDALIGALD